MSNYVLENLKQQFMGITVRTIIAIVLLIFGIFLLIYYYFSKNNMSNVIPILGFFIIAFGAKLMRDVYMHQS